MDANELPSLDEAVGPFRKMVEASRDGRVPPAVLIVGGPGEVRVVTLDGHGDLDMQDKLRMALPKVETKFGRPTWLVVVSEAYADLKVDPNAPPEHGDLSARAEAGETVQDVVVVAGIHINGRQLDAVLPFKRTDGVVTWDPAITPPPGVKADGGIFDVLRSGLRPNPFSFAHPN